jgi:hypothetical protein
MGSSVAGGDPFELVAETQLTSSSSNTSSWTASNTASWQANDVVVCTVTGRIANSAGWDPDSGTLSSPDASLSVTNVFGQRRADNFGEYQQIFYGVATGSYSGTGNWSWADNTTGQVSNRRAHLWVMRGDGSAPSGYSTIGAVTGVSPITLTTGATTGDRIISMATAPSAATAITYTGDGTPSTEVSFYNVENHDGIQFFHDDEPAEVEVTTTGTTSIYCGIVVSP